MSLAGCDCSDSYCYPYHRHDCQLKRFSLERIDNLVKTSREYPATFIDGFIGKPVKMVNPFGKLAYKAIIESLKSELADGMKDIGERIDTKGCTKEIRAKIISAIESGNPKTMMDAA